MAELAADDPYSIGGYRLLSRLGAGGMGRVYLARSEGGRTVAVKLIKAELAAQTEFRTRFRLEVEAARRVGQRWTAPVLDADTEAETPWVATGYIAGPSLEQVVSSRVQSEKHGPLPDQSIRTLAYGLASALLDIHGAGLIHRDLKPSNVLVTIDGPRVIDFGIARALDALPDSTVTGTGVIVGSPSYMSPEQIRAEQVGPASDVFCMGAVLAYAATGRTPFGGGSDGGGSGGIHALMFRIASEEPDLEGIEEPLRGLIASCLAKDPAARIAPEDVIAGVQPISTGTSSAPWLPATLIAELGRHAVQLLDTDTPPSGSGSPHTVVQPATPDPEPDPEPEPVPSRRPGRRRIAFAALAAVVVAGVAFAASGAELPLLGSHSGSGGGQGDSDIPEGYVGAWTGKVTRDGEPTGQYRRFVISPGRTGEIVANSTSLGRNYECKSDGKLVSAGKSLDLDTKVVKSVPQGKCSALGSHTLTLNSDSTLTWEAAGRTATLHRAPDPEQLPKEYLGRWQRSLPGGGSQQMTVTQPKAGSRTITLISEGTGQHCEAGMDLFSAGGPKKPVRVAPPAVDKAASSGACVTGSSSTLRFQGGTLVREFPSGGRPLTYTRTG